MVWKVSISGAGSSEFNGDYIWDGATLVNSKPLYIGPPPYGGENARIEWSSVDNIWYLIFDIDRIYQSANLTAWARPSGGGDEPAPTGTLFYT